MSQAEMMRDLARELQVIKPQPERPHAFQRSPLNRACALCAQRRRAIVHPHEARFTY